ncbi:hypothetical protein OF83DRAFT_1180621 [Amylostereum chailletii]|nr:hypothetical protein OF83DRAFT_1180621 [Amylostereum chailletii]
MAIPGHPYHPYQPNGFFPELLMSTKTCEYLFRYLSGTSVGIGIRGYKYPWPKYP